MEKSESDRVDGLSMERSQIPSLTDSSLTEARSLRGILLRRTAKSLQVTSDLMRQFAYLMGDENPLFCDEQYARGTRWGGLIAPPTMLYQVDNTVVAPKLPGVQWVYAGADWHWFQPVMVGDIITTERRLVDAAEKAGGHVRRMILQIGEVIFRNQRDEVVAKVYSRTMRTPRSKASGGLSYESRLHKYSLEELGDLFQACQSEARRGAIPRYWEDTEAGQEVSPIIKGPLRAEDIAFGGHLAGGEGQPGSGLGAHVFQLLHRRRHPADAYIDPKTGVQDHPHRGHWEEHMAREVGMPGIYDIGYQRIMWLSQLMCDWMGDSAFLKRLDVSLRRPNVVGDTSWCKGKVTRKLVQDGEHLVECEVWVENQANERTATGAATVAFPHRTAVAEGSEK